MSMFTDTTFYSEYGKTDFRITVSFNITFVIGMFSKTSRMPTRTGYTVKIYGVN
ncbi:MAG: hypothetical protein GX913_04480 [Clostridiales bacterium]|nr:hypothetical protein [Clostridiales bacterium]